MNFSDLTVFEETKKTDDSIISITSENKIILRQGFIRNARCDLENMTHVILSYSQSNRVIVFNFTDNKNAKGSFTLSKATNTENFIICSTQFFSFFEIKERVFGKYFAELNKIGEKGYFWTINLNNKIR